MKQADRKKVLAMAVLGIGLPILAGCSAMGGGGAVMSPTTGYPEDTDTQQLLFTSNRDGNWEIYSMAEDGAAQTNLTRHRGDDQSPAWSPDGKRIAFFANRDGNNEIYAMNTDGSHPIRLTRNETDDQYPSWSPDGKRILFVSDRDGNRELYVMNADGTDPTNLTRTPDANETDRYWMPDGRSIIYSLDRDGLQQIYSMTSDGTNPIRLSRTQASDGYPQPSPNGMRVAFISDRSGTRDLYVMNADGSDARPLLGTVSRSLCTAFSWSPDGRQIAFATEQDGNNEVYIMNADGSEKVNLTHSPTDEGVNKLSWSPDGQYLSYSGRAGDNWEIYRMGVATGQPIRLTDSPGDDLDPKWRPDSDAHHAVRRAAVSSPDAPLASPAALPPITFELNRRISDYEEAHYWTHTFSSGGHSLALLGNTLYAVWYDVRSGNSDVYFTKSMDGGRTFSANKKVNDDATKEVQYKPSIGVDGQGTIYIAWRDGRRNGNADIFFARSTDGGKTFSRNVRLNDDRGAAYQGNPTLAVNSKGVVAVAWSDARNGKDDIYITISKNQGWTFSANHRVNDDPETTAHSHPSVAVDAAGVVYVAWEDFRNDNSDIYLATSRDGGATFSPNRRVNDDSGSAPQISPSLAIGPSDQILVAWGDFRNSGVTLPPPHSATGEEQRWEVSRTGNADIYFSRSLDNGGTFSANLRLNDDPAAAAQAFPSLTVNAQGVVAVAWEDFRNGDPDIYLAKSGDGGATFGSNRRANDDPGHSEQYHPSLALDRTGTAYLIWTDSRNNRFSSRGDGNDDQGDDVFFAKESAAFARK
jgi:TolB protein